MMYRIISIGHWSCNYTQNEHVREATYPVVPRSYTAARTNNNKKK